MRRGVRMQNQQDRDRERFAELIWTRGDQILDDLSRLRAFLADCVRDEHRRDVLLAAISKGMAEDIRVCRAEDFPLRKMFLARRLSHFASGYAKWTIDTLSFAIGPKFDPEMPYQKARTLLSDQVLSHAILGRLTEQEKRSLRMAARLLLRAGEAGHSDALVWYGEILRGGIGVEENPVDALVFLRRAAEMGNTTAQMHIGTAYLWGNGVTKSCETAIEWLTLAAKGGNAEAQYQLGTQYSLSDYAGRDIGQAHRWFKEAANQNHEMATQQMAILCEKEGNIPGAVAWYKKLAESGGSSVMYELACERIGALCEKEGDILGARFWYMRLAEAESGQDGYRQLGALCEREGDISGALAWYTKAGEAGDEAAYKFLGDLYKKQHDIPNALASYKKLAVAGLKIGYACVGDLFGDLLNDGSASQRMEALGWYQEGARLGCEICSSRLHQIQCWQARVTHTEGFGPPELGPVEERDSRNDAVPREIDWLDLKDFLEDDPAPKLILLCNNADEWQDLQSSSVTFNTVDIVCFVHDQNRKSCLAWVCDHLPERDVENYPFFGDHPGVYFEDGRGYHPSHMPAIVAIRSGTITDCAAAGYRVRDEDNAIFPLRAQERFESWRKGTLEELHAALHKFLDDADAALEVECSALYEQFESDLRKAGTLEEYERDDQGIVSEGFLEIAKDRYCECWQWPPDCSVENYLADCIPKLRESLNR